jgi:hypothetical protein
MLHKVKKVIIKARQKYYTTKVKKGCGSYKLVFKVNGKSAATPKIFLGKNINFNVIQISGCGEIHIEDNAWLGSRDIVLGVAIGEGAISKREVLS